jgi:type IV pilus assembly protein PilY1
MKRLNTVVRELFARKPAILLAAAALWMPSSAGVADDTVLFTAAVAPNVLLHVDNSGSMNNIVWHEAYDPSVTPACTRFNNSSEYTVSSDVSYNASSSSGCVAGNRTIWEDPEISDPTRWSGHYLNWYFSDAATPYVSDIGSATNGSESACLGGATFSKYRRSRVTAAQQILHDVICQVNETGEVRFGLSKFRLGSDPRGGYVRVGIADYSAAHGTALANAINELEGETWTPLGESYYQIYSYFLPRSSTGTPYGQNGTTRFLDYRFSTSGTLLSAGSSSIPEDPVQYSCQKNFVIVITDGEPTRDDFDNSGGTDTDWGLERFFQVIGDYNSDGEVETPGYCSGDECAFYLDDIAKWAQDNDLRPDKDGTQTIDTYTVGFTTNATANALLSKTAEVGNGLFFQSNNAEELTAAIVQSVSDIIQKSQSFTAATVPASRTTDGNDIFFSSFVPSDEAGFWQGHLKNYEFTLDGRILDANGDCALDDPSGDCFFGPLLPTAPPIFDAAEEIADPVDRVLYTSLAGALSSFDTTALAAADLDLVDDEGDGAADEIAQYSGILAGTAATTLEGLADQIIDYFRGCAFGTDPCVRRDSLSPPESMLGDIFHSNPVVIAPPNAALNEESYVEFAQKYEHRTRIIYGGSNDGFLHAFNAGTWSTLLGAFQEGTGEEIFGFMPYQARERAQYQPLDSGSRDYYFVDGSPQAADVWIHSTTTDETKEMDEWHTVMIGGMRQGGSQYYALDITNPDGETGGPSFPAYLWEFPSEDTGHANAVEAPYMGETWSEPILTRVRVEVSGDLGSSGHGYERWVAIFGAGFSVEGDPNDEANYIPTSLKGRAIYVVEIKTGNVLAAKRFNPGATATGWEAQMDYAFPSAPAVFDLDRDGYADVAYIGDMGGQLWRWVMTDPDPDNWLFQKVLVADPFTYTHPVTGDGMTYWRNFFFPPTGLLRNGVLWLGLGTGERHNLKFEGIDVDGDGEPDADNDGDNNRYYVFSDIDPLEVSGDTDLPLDESKLVDVTDANCDTPIDRGYYVIAEHAEKFVTNSIVFLGTLFTGSFVPIDSTDPCVAGGEAYLWMFRFSCGEGDGSGATENEKRKSQLGTGLPTSPRISVGNSEEEEGECEEMKVVVITSEGEVSSDCAGHRPNSGTYLREWRED